VNEHGAGIDLALRLRRWIVGTGRSSTGTTGAPGSTYHLQLLGGEAGRWLAQEQTEAVAAVLAWLAAHLLSLPRLGLPLPARSASRPGRNGDASRDMAGSAHRRRLR
jgi:hypothetical protein